MSRPGCRHLQRLGNRLNGHYLRISIDKEIFWRIVKHIKETRQSERTIDELILADAPLAMMTTLYGMSNREYTARRRINNVPPTVGRPPEPDEITQTIVWEAWRQRLGNRDPEEFSPQEYLDVHHQTGAPVRAIWNLIQRWIHLGSRWT